MLPPSPTPCRENPWLPAITFFHYLQVQGHTQLQGQWSQRASVNPAHPTIIKPIQWGTQYTPLWHQAPLSVMVMSSEFFLSHEKWYLFISWEMIQSEWEIYIFPHSRSFTNFDTGHDINTGLWLVDITFTLIRQLSEMRGCSQPKSFMFSLRALSGIDPAYW